MSTLTQIVPPLTQSLYETMACPYSYAKQQIEGRHTADSAASWRGTEVHKVMAQYIEHCRRERKPADWLAFDRIAATVGNEAGRICDGLRDNYIVDWEQVNATEKTLYLNADFQPSRGNHDTAAYKGTLDALYMLSGDSVRIDDFKSHPQPFEPDTMQALLYPVLAFQRMAEVQAITFRLIFVRYKNLYREVTWQRSDLPRMMAELARARARQESYHAIYDASGIDSLPVLPHAGCHYCPLLQQGDCPKADVNPHADDPQDLVRELLYMSKRQAHIKGILKDVVQARGSAITAEDANGTAMSYGPVESESLGYPANALIDTLRMWCVASNDQAMLDGLRISSTTIKPKLATKKRAALREQIEGRLVKTTKVKTKLTTKNIGEDAEDEDEY